jgi:hypothetical protein
MITVEQAYALEGYSGHDHLIDDSRLAEIEGKEFRSVAAAMDAACRRCYIGGTPSIARRRHGAVGLRIRFSNGAVETRSSMT